MFYRTLAYFNCQYFGFLGWYLRTDISQVCFSRGYNSILVLALINFVVYVVGIPFFIYFVVQNKEKEWAKEASRPLYINFNSEWAFYEVFELIRKLLLVSVVGFVVPGTASQCLYLFLVDAGALLLLCICRPYANSADDILSGVFMLTECIVFLLAFIIISEVYQVDNYNKTAVTDSATILLFAAIFIFVPLNILFKVPATQNRSIKDAFRLFFNLREDQTTFSSKCGFEVNSEFDSEPNKHCLMLETECSDSNAVSRSISQDNFELTVIMDVEDNGVEPFTTTNPIILKH